MMNRSPHEIHKALSDDSYKGLDLGRKCFKSIKPALNTLLSTTEIGHFKHQTLSDQKVLEGFSKISDLYTRLMKPLLTIATSLKDHSYFADELSECLSHYVSAAAAFCVLCVEIQCRVLRVESGVAARTGSLVEDLEKHTEKYVTNCGNHISNLESSLKHHVQKVQQREAKLNSASKKMATRGQQGPKLSDRPDVDEVIQLLLKLGLERLSVSPVISSRESRKGGYGTVTEGSLPGGRLVAVKTINETKPDGTVLMFDRQCKRLVREARVLASLGSHPRVTQLQGFWEGDNPGSLPYLVTSLCNQGDLFRYLRLVGRIVHLKDRLSLLTDAAEGLHYLHYLDPPVIHADLKINNVLVHDGRALLCDFGISRILDDVEWLDTHQSGTDPYLPPERKVEPQNKAFHKPNIYSDMYAFGCVFLETLTGSMLTGLSSKSRSADWTPMDEVEQAGGQAVIQPLTNGATPQQSRADEPHPKKLQIVKNYDDNFRNPNAENTSIRTDHWELMRKLWHPNPWKRQTSGELLIELREARDSVSDTCPPS